MKSQWGEPVRVSGIWCLKYSGDQEKEAIIAWGENYKYYISIRVRDTIYKKWPVFGILSDAQDFVELVLSFSEKKIARLHGNRTIKEHNNGA